MSGERTVAGGDPLMTRVVNGLYALGGRRRLLFAAWRQA